MTNLTRSRVTLLNLPLDIYSDPKVFFDIHMNTVEGIEYIQRVTLLKLLPN